MNSAAFALASAACWGASDFMGGVAARRISPFFAVAVAHSLSLIVMIAFTLGLSLQAPSHALTIVALCAGLFGGGGLMLFYEALSRGSMGATAAIAGVLTAAVPMLYGLHAEGLPKMHQLAGFLLAVIAIWLIASAASGESAKLNARNLWLGTVSGLCFGTYFLLLKLASAGGVLWAMTMSRVTSTALAGLVCFVFILRPRADAAPNRWGWKALALAAAVGALDTGGNLLYLVATTMGRLDIAAVLSSLYPAFTILLAAWILKERTTRTQSIGMALAVGAVALIAA